MHTLDDRLNPKKSFQGLILSLQNYWAKQGCCILQSYDMEMGAGTFHPATILRSLGPKPWNVAFAQACRRPTDGRYGENPNRLQHYYQFQVLLKPAPANIQELYLGSLAILGLDGQYHDIRFVEDDWESPSLGAAGLGWECWCDGMEVSQFTYFQQVCGIECEVVAGEITYGLERLAMYLQGVDNVYDLNFNGGEGEDKVSYGEIFLVAEQEYSRYNFSMISEEYIKDFNRAEQLCLSILEQGAPKEAGGLYHCVLPAYDQCIKASHLLNLLQAGEKISATQRQDYILRVRQLAQKCGAAFLQTAAGGAHKEDSEQKQAKVS